MASVNLTKNEYGQYLLYNLSHTAVSLALYAVDKSQVVIDSATHLLTISSPCIDYIAMSLYDIRKRHIIITLLGAFFLALLFEAHSQ